MSKSQGTALASPQERFQTIRDFLSKDALRKNMQQVLPRHMTPDRVARVALSACSRSPQLLECSPESLAKSLLDASEVGLEPNGRDGYLVPFWNSKNGRREAQFIAGYQGLIKLAYQSGIVKMVMARAVFAADEFKYKYGTGSTLSHVPSDSEDRGALKYAWAMAQIEGGGEPFVVLNRQEIMRHKASSQGADSSYSPWKTHEDAMWMKTAVRELIKFLPASSEKLERVLERERDLEFGTTPLLDIDTGQVPVTEPPKKSKAETLREKLDSAAEPTGLSTTTPTGIAEHDPDVTVASGGMVSVTTAVRKPKQAKGDLFGRETSSEMSDVAQEIRRASNLDELSWAYDRYCGPDTQLKSEADIRRAGELCEIRRAELKGALS